MERVLDKETGSMRNVMTFRCRRCAARFNDDQWRVDCRAPHLKRTRAQHDPIDDIQRVHMTEADLTDAQRAAIAELKKKGW